MMKNVRFLALSLAVSVGALAAVGCSGATASEQPQTSASAVTKAPVGQNTHGMVKVVGEALGEVALRPDQRAELEKLAAAADARHAATLDGRKDLMLAVATQVESGAIDRAALQPKIDRVQADMAKLRPEDQAALQRVHAILDADQRNAFVDALQAKMKGKHHGPPGGERGEHAAKGDHAAWGFGPMKQLADDMKLTDDQRTQIHDVLKAERANAPKRDWSQIRERFHAGKQAMDSFRTDTFSPPAAPSGEAAKMGEGHMIGIAEKIVPLLTPEQRKIAADKIREMANKGGPAPFEH